MHPWFWCNWEIWFRSYYIGQNECNTVALKRERLVGISHFYCRPYFHSWRFLFQFTVVSDAACHVSMFKVLLGRFLRTNFRMQYLSPIVINCYDICLLVCMIMSNSLKNECLIITKSQRCLHILSWHTASVSHSGCSPYPVVNNATPPPPIFPKYHKFGLPVSFETILKFCPV